MARRDVYLRLLKRRVAVLRWVAALTLLSSALAIGLLKLDNSPEIWLPEGDPEVELYQRFQRHFGSDSFVALMSGGSRGDGGDQVARLQAELESIPGVASLESPFDSKGVLREGAAFQRLVNPRGDRFVILVGLSSGLSPSEVVRLLDDVESRTLSYPALGPFSMVGTEMVTRELNRGSEQSFGGLFPLVALVLSGLLWLVYRSLRMVGAIFLCVIGSVATALFTFGLGGATLNLLVVLMPAILVVLTVAASIHLCNRYLDLARLSSQAEQAERNLLWSVAVEQTVIPCGLATLTTALGFGSLALSRIGPVRDLGLYTAIGAFWVLLFVFLLLPPLLAGRPLPLRRGPEMTRWVAAYARFLRQRRLAIVALGFGTLALLSLGIPRLNLESNVMSFFAPDHPLPRAYEDFEANFFGLTSFEILLEGALSQVYSVESFEILDHLERHALATGIAAQSFSPWLDDDGSKAAVERAGQLKAVLRKIPRELEGYVWRGGGSASLRVTLNAPTGSSNQAYRSVEALRDEIQRLPIPPGVNLRVGGSAPLLVRGQVLLLDTQIRSFATALFFITLVIALAYRSVRLTALSIVCNVFPIAGVLGTMGWLDIPLNAGTVTVAGIALGLIVDDTIHIIHGCSEPGIPESERLAHTLNTVGKPILVTTVAVACGFGLFSFADFQPTRYFGMLTALTSLFAIGADLVILPACLTWSDGAHPDPHDTQM